jgi:predicted oxidoreductase
VEPPFLAIRVYAAVTHTIGGLRIDDRARVLREDGSAVPGLHAAGADAGGIFTGGYGSGLAAALVFGRLAAESALAG